MPVASARILLVDDDRLFREAFTDLLRARGHEVIATSDADEALARYEPGGFDVLLVDLVMPGRDGIALAGAIRQRDPDQEVVFVTQRDDVATAISALRAGASDYLLKPVDDAELLRCIDRCLDRARLRRERARLLDENLEFMRHQVLYRRCMELLSTLDLEKLQENALADICSVCDAQSGAIWIADDEGALLLRAYRGLVDRSKLTSRIDPAQSFPAALHRGLAGREPFAAPGIGGGAWYLPLWAAGERVGLVLCADKLTGDFVPQDQSVARAVGDFAATAIRNARRYAAVERIGLRDPESAAYNLSYFVDYAGKEFYKARRYGRVFSLITVGLDHFEDYRSRHGAEAAKAVSRAITAALGRVVRDSDVVAKASENEFYLLLPETDHIGALMFGRRAQAAIDAEPALREASGPGGPQAVLGAATFPRDGQDFDELLHACRNRMEESRRSLARTLGLGALDFWSAVDLILGDKQSPPLPPDGVAGPSRRGWLPPGLFPQLQVELALELARDPRARGLLYIGAGELRADLPVLAPLESLPADTGIRVHLLGRRADLESHPLATPVFLEGDERILKHQFVLLFSENASYALVQRRATRGPPWGFHSSDAALVEELVSKLQERYDLQPF